MTDRPILDQIMEHKDHIMSRTPHAMAMGIELIDAAQDGARMKIPYAPHLVGDPETGVVHGGVITTLLDHASGLAVMCAVTDFISIATLDLRIDYHAPATPNRDILCHAHCYKLTKSIAFVRGTAYHETPDDPIAASVGAFMLGANRAPSTFQTGVTA